MQGGIAAIQTELFALQMLRGLNNFPILAIPFFIFAASLMNAGSVANRIFDFANALAAFIRGGLPARRRERPRLVQRQRPCCVCSRRGADPSCRW
jgi:hypothetical protein